MFQRNDKYYSGIVYEWNLPTGWTCPGASGCLVRVDRKTGIATNLSTEYRCYSASAERFPGVRDSRWENLDVYRNGGRAYRDGGLPDLPRAALHVRIHASGDFYSQAYFDDWLTFCRDHFWVRFWAYTKSLKFWALRIDDIPKNLVLTASLGGKFDHMALDLGMRTATVISPLDPRAQAGPIDINDDLARVPGPSFFLIDNYARG